MQLDSEPEEARVKEDRRSNYVFFIKVRQNLLTQTGYMAGVLSIVRASVTLLTEAACRVATPVCRARQSRGP